MTDEHKETPQNLSPQVITTVDMAVQRSADFKSIYANNTKFGASPFEFSFIFGEIGENVEGRVFIDQKVKVMMSPVHAKLFLIVFAQNVSNFEAQFGEINIPEGLFGVAPSQTIVEPRINEKTAT